MESEYVSWLRRRGVKLFESPGCYWRLYHGRVLIPATLAPTYVGVSSEQAKSLLKESGASLLRFSSDPCEGPSEWWYIVCDRYDPQTFNHKTRQKINKGRRECRVALVDPEWLAGSGYSCYLAAHERYTRAVPAAEEQWRAGILATRGGPFEYWAVFVDQQLAGYCQCVVEGDRVTTAAGKYDPAYFKHRPVNALTSFLGEHYVRDRNCVLANGNRGILHDTNMQDFLIDHGFRQQFCRLNVIYTTWLDVAIRVAFPLRNIFHRWQDMRLAQPITTLLIQEEIRRACLLTSGVTY